MLFVVSFFEHPERKTDRGIMKTKNIFLKIREDRYFMMLFHKKRTWYHNIVYFYGFKSTTVSDMAFLIRNSLKRLVIILFIFSFITLTHAQEAKVSQKKIDREHRKKEKAANKQYQKLLKMHEKNQSKETRAMMKRSKKDSKKNTPMHPPKGKKCY